MTKSSNDKKRKLDKFSPELLEQTLKSEVLQDSQNTLDETNLADQLRKELESPQSKTEAEQLYGLSSCDSVVLLEDMVVEKHKFYRGDICTFESYL